MTSIAMQNEHQPTLDQYLAVRGHSEILCEPLQAEDYGLQAMASTSPAKWHLAHTTWFFETFILKPFLSGYQPRQPQFEYLFNSYYNGIGEQFPRHKRGLLSRPSIEEVMQYRSQVDECIITLLESHESRFSRDILSRLRLGCHHEQQHQELFFTDLKYSWFQNPLAPAYIDGPMPESIDLEPIGWQNHEAQLAQIGHNHEGGFSFDNELPRHPHYVTDFSIADRLVSNGEFLEFILDEGYQRPELWLADGWTQLADRKAESGRNPAPLYWIERDGRWYEYTLYGLSELDYQRPACHLSAYEADAYARWKNCRLPTEFEWELSMAGASHTRAKAQTTGEQTPAIHPDSCDVVGNLWQWTSSAYSPYPGFKAAAGAIGEYNGKFMANQLVLRGGSVVTSPGHYRHSYRNFFYPPDQWQFTGLRLAQDL
ncbi:MAG: ergothioneine biosynthesis protein EgtB [Halioglobus sp.]